MITSHQKEKGFINPISLTVMLILLFITGCSSNKTMNQTAAGNSIVFNNNVLNDTTDVNANMSLQGGLK